MRRTLFGLTLSLVLMAGAAFFGTRSSADPETPASPAKPRTETPTPLCGSPTDRKGCPAGEDADEPPPPGASVSAPGPAAPGASSNNGHELPAGKPWHIQGNLSEACTCSVPCTCNFGLSPSPQHFCHAIFSLDIQTGRYGDVSLDGLRLAAGNAAQGTVWYLDERATPAQDEAMRVIARTIDAKLVAYWKTVDPKTVEGPEFRLLGFQKARIVQEVGEKSNRLQIGDAGRFESDYLMGIDGKTPIVLENNWSWNIQHGIKGQTRKLTYRDSFGNRIDTASTNANQGRFDWSDQTPLYLR